MPLLSFGLGAILRPFQIVKTRIEFRTRKAAAIPTLAHTTFPRLIGIGCLGSVAAFANGIATTCSKKPSSKSGLTDRKISELVTGTEVSTDHS